MTRKTPLYREIWLEPVCADCWTPSSEICWCDDNVFEPCPNCDMKPTRYVIDQRQLLKRKTASEIRQRTLDEAAHFVWERIGTQHDDLANAIRNLATNLCEDCPPFDYTTDATRCAPCPRRAHPVPGTSCMGALATNKPCRPDEALKRCTICGFVVDTKFKAEL